MTFTTFGRSRQFSKGRSMADLVYDEAPKTMYLPEMMKGTLTV